MIEIPSFNELIEKSIVNNWVRMLLPILKAQLYSIMM